MTPEARANTIWRHVREHIVSSGTTWPAFARAVREHYEATVPEPQRRVEFSGHRDSYERMRLDAQLVRRFEHDVRYGLPADLEEAMVLALPEPARARCLAALAGRYGLLAAPIPRRGAGDGIACLGALTKEFADVLKEVAPMWADGTITQAEHDAARRALREIRDLEAQLASLRTALKNALGDGQVVSLPVAS